MMMMRERSIFSIPRDTRKRISYIVFCAVFLCSVANFMFVILPRMLYPGEYMKVNNKVNCNEKKDNKPIKQKFEVVDEFNHIKNVYEHDIKVNGKYCNEQKCKFLLAYFPPNMDTSTSDIEFLTYVKLAESLGRIMVLTNVRSKKISTCQPFPFSLYYDINKLQQNFPNVKFITQDEFQKWSYQRFDKPSTSHYYLTDGGEENSIINTPPYSDSLRKIWCLDRFKLKLNDTTTPFKLLRLSWNNWLVDDNGNHGRDDLKNFLINNLQDNSDVLLIRHDIREPIFLKSELPPYLPYSKVIDDTATKIINSLRPYIAVQWDFENTNGPVLSTCASRLLSKVQKTIDHSEIENIYFVSDYPLHRFNEIISSNSTHPIINRSTHRFSHTHTETIKFISSTIPYYTADSLGALKPFENISKDELEESNIREIIDKLICIKADRYIGLPKWPCNDRTDIKRTKLLSELRGYYSVENRNNDTVIRF